MAGLFDSDGQREGKLLPCPGRRRTGSFILEGRMNVRILLTLGVILGLIAFLVWGLASSGGGELEPGREVPSMELATLPAGGNGSLADYRGEWVLMNVWASWCVPCREESPALERFAKSTRGEVRLLGIDTRDLSGDALRFLREFGITYPQLRDPDGSYADDLRTSGVPESFLIDPEGRLAGRFKGPFPNFASIRNFAEPALSEGGTR